jgi:hypothetical protein
MNFESCKHCGKVIILRTPTGLAPLWESHGEGGPSGLCTGNVSAYGAAGLHEPGTYTPKQIALILTPEQVDGIHAAVLYLAESARVYNLLPEKEADARFLAQVIREQADVQSVRLPLEKEDGK